MDPGKAQTADNQYLDLEKTGGSSDRLSIFREKVGITEVLDVRPRTSKRKAPNIGIYNRIAVEEREAKLQYFFSALVINTCLLAQVVFASALTALGAGHGSHTQITTLGAANTVIAAVLTFTKGQGLPNRLRQYQCSLRRIREHIEQRERDFAQPGCQLDIDEEMRAIMGMYEEVRQNDENNDPSTYHAAVASPVKGRALLNDGASNLSSLKVEPGTAITAKKAIPTDVLEEERMGTTSPGLGKSHVDVRPCFYRA